MKRYDMFHNTSYSYLQSQIEEHENGDYVLYEDAAAIEARHDALLDENLRLRMDMAAIDHWRNVPDMIAKERDDLRAQLKDTEEARDLWEGAERKAIAERDKLRGQRDRMAALLKISYMYAMYVGNLYHADKIEVLFAEIEKESNA